jgi:opacity protein-like surface antigen
MNQLRACRSVSGVLLLTALCGLFSVPPTHAEEDVRRATPPPGKALLFVFRIDREPSAARVPVIVNTVLVGELANGTFVTATVGPGRNYLKIGDEVPSTLVVEANQSYFVRVRTLGDPPSVRTEVNLVSEAEGRRSLAQSRFFGVAPAATAPRPQTPPAPITAAPPPKPPPVATTAAPPPKPSPAPITAAPPTQQPSDAAAPAATQPTAGRETSTPTESGGNWDFALIANAGTFKLANSNQVVAGLASTYDTTSKSVFGVEAEWRHKAGFAVGGEVFYYKNDLVTTGAIPSAQQEVLAFMVNGKYYFRAASWFYPFVGAGVGQTNASYSGGLTGKATGLAYQGLAGMEFRFNQIGLNVQYKYLDSTTGGTGKDVKVGGGGILAGVSIVF